VPEPLGQRFPALRKLSQDLLVHHGFVKTVGISNMVLGGLLGTYTGILLSSLGARPLWSSPILGLLFVVSGLSGAAAFVHMVARSVYERELMAKSDNAFLVIELFVIGMLLLWMVTASEVHMNAAKLLLGGPYTAVFWVFVVLLGIVIPLTYQSLAVSHKVGHCPLMPILVIAGGLVLRFVIVYAGQHSHWMALAVH
jgi:formate-dependent nitrite reductase membrane component NrfD